MSFNIEHIQNNNEKIPDFDLYISHVAIYHKKNEFIELFKKLNWGIVKDVQFYYKKQSKLKTVSINFDKWYDDNNNIYEIKKTLYNGESFKIMYNFPNYWQCYKNKFSNIKI